ncbi:MAG TPA: TonB-dependent receptor [Candidatus Saccharimonadales bacterium]|nr:TonB-dependent receptor [Candidatus Saccharimonadales bacterium]
MITLRRIVTFSFCLLLILCDLLLAQRTSAQSATDGAIGGGVTDSSGALVPNAAVRTMNLATNNSASGTSNDYGRFVVLHLAPGIYSVEVSATGFASFKATSITVEVGRLTNLDVSLGVQSQSETVVATAEAPVITTDRADFSTNFNIANVENLPINGRRWSTLALSTPGAVSDGTFGLVSFRGISGLLNNNTVDGGDNNQAFFAEEKGRTRINYSISQASIQELQVNTSNFSAEYGRSAGGVVNAITRSGSNQFHGQAFWFYRSSDFGAYNPFQSAVVPSGSAFVTVPIKPEDKRHQFGGNIGGPIYKDKLFFFFNADQQKRNFPGVANASSPSAFFSPLSTTCSPAPCVPELTQLALRGITADQANAGLQFLQSLTGVVPRTGDELVLFPKIDWIINPDNKFSVQYNRMRWSSPAGVQTAGVVFRGVDSFGNDFVKDDTINARLVSTINSTMINEFRFQYGRDFEFQNTQQSIPGEPVSAQGISPQITINGSAGIAFGKPNFLDRRSYPDERSLQFADTYSINKSAHLLKFGFDIVRFNDVNDNLFQESGAYSYTNRVDYISDYVSAVDGLGPVCGTTVRVGCYTSFNQGFGPTKFELSTLDFGFFIQDDWRISPRLTLNLGLRWDYEKLPDPQIPNPSLPLTSQFPDDKNNFGPRIGFAWDIDGRGKTVLRGGYGTYYGRIINSTISNAITNIGSPDGQFQFTYRPSDVAPLPAPPLYPNVAAGPGATPANVGDVIQFAKDTQAPMIHQFDLVFEKEIANNTAVSVSWVGSLGRYLPVFLDTNLNEPTATITYTASGGLFDGQNLTLPLFTGPRPVSGFGRITSISDVVHSRYNAFIAQFNRRLTNGVQFNAFYTYSNTTDNGQGSQTFTSGNNVLNPFDLNGEEGRANFDIRHHIGATALWQPAFFHHSGRVVRAALDGWGIAPVVSVSSGVPYTGTVTGNAPGGTFLGINGSGGTSRLPELARNSFQMPRNVNVDLRLAKKFSLTEALGLELFGEAFNLFNHVNVTGVGTTEYSISGTTLVADPRFGVPNSSQNSTQTTTQRQIQIGAKFTW